MKHSGVGPLWVILLCALLASGAAFSGAYAQAPDLSKLDVVLRSVPDGPVAKVNGANIGKDEFIGLYQGELMPMIQAFKSKNEAVPDAVRVDTAVRTMGMLIHREILYQEAVKRKLAVTDEDVSKGWNSQLERMKAAFAKMNNKTLSEADILRMAGATREQAMAELKKALLIERMRDEIAKQKNVTVSDDEIAKVYAEKKDLFKQAGGYHLLRIYINTRAKERENLPALDPGKKAAAKEKIEAALKRIQAGESFETVAKAVSEAPDKDTGGDAGFVPETGLPDSYIKKLAAMKPGEVSGVFEDDLGFHVIKLIEHKAGGEVALDKAKPQIRHMLLVQKTDHATNEYCQQYMTEKPDSVQVFLQLEKNLSANPEFKKAKEQAAIKAGKNTSESPAAKSPAAKSHKKKAASTSNESAPAPAKPKKAKHKQAEDVDVGGSS